MAKTAAKPIAKTAASQELPKRNDGIHPPIVESEGIVGEPLRLGKGRGGDEVRGCALRATGRSSQDGPRRHGKIEANGPGPIRKAWRARLFGGLRARACGGGLKKALMSSGATIVASRIAYWPSSVSGACSITRSQEEGRFVQKHGRTFFGQSNRIVTPTGHKRRSSLKLLDFLALACSFAGDGPLPQPSQKVS